MRASNRAQHVEQRRRSTSTSPRPTIRPITNVPEPKAEDPEKASVPAPNDVHPTVMALAVGAYATLVTLLWLAFARTAEGALIMLIVTLVFAASAILPLIALRLTRRDRSGPAVTFREYLEQTTDTLTGPLEGRAAMVQIIAVPALLNLCVIGIGVAVALAH